MANEEVLGPRKTMFVLVIVVGCFAVLWPRILSPMVLGPSRDHMKPNQFDRDAALKQERPPIRAGPHPALLERGRAIPPSGAPPAPPRPAPLPPHVRPPPIPGMRPPLGAGGGPVPAPKSSMGLVMPIYTICIIVFFVYTLSKILFKRTGTPYDQLSPDPQFRRRVFRDDSRTSPDKLVVTAISGLVAEVQQQMEASYAQNQQRQELQENRARPYTNGTVIHSGPVQIVASEYREPSKEKSPVKEKEPSPEPKEPSPEPKESSPEPKESSPESKEPSPELIESKEATPESKEASPEHKEASPEPKEPSPEPVHKPKEPTPENDEEEEVEEISEEEESSPEKEIVIEELKKITDNIEILKDSVVKLTEDFLNKEKSKEDGSRHTSHVKRTTSDLLEEALKEDSPGKDENATVKVLGMEVSQWAEGGVLPPSLSHRAPHRPTHEADEVKSIFLETEIPQQSRVLVADFVDTADNAPATKHAPLVVSGKMTLSLIQDAPRDTPERDPESTMDEFTTASAVTQPANEKEELSDEEIEEEIEVEEIEEIEEEEEELEEDPLAKEKTQK